MTTPSKRRGSLPRLCDSLWLGRSSRELLRGFPPRVAEEQAMRRAFRVVLRRALNVRAVGAQLPRLTVVGETRFQQRLEPRVKRAILHRRDRLHATIEVPRHPVRRSEEVPLLRTIREVEQPRVL